jgi:hypothetical protein
LFSSQDLFFKYSLNNFLHTQVEQCVTQVFEWKSEEEEQAATANAANTSLATTEEMTMSEDPDTPKIVDGGDGGEEEEEKMDTGEAAEKKEGEVKAEEEKKEAQEEEKKKEEEAAEEEMEDKPYENPMLVHVSQISPGLPDANFEDLTVPYVASTRAGRGWFFSWMVLFLDCKTFYILSALYKLPSGRTCPRRLGGERQRRRA